MKFFQVLALASCVSASPLVERARNICDGVNLIVTVLKLNKATPFCSSYLSIQTVTRTQVVTETTVLPGPTTVVTATTGTDTVLQTITETNIVTQTVPTTALVTAVVTVSGSTVVTLRKRETGLEERAPRTVAIPPFLTKFASGALSTACSCLSIPTPSVTVTETSTTSPIGPTQTSVIPTADVTTATIPVTQQLTELTTVVVPATTTTTTTAIATSTFIPEACKNPTMLNNGYFPRVRREFDIIPIANNYSAQRCCSRCWSTPNCFSWAWGGFISGGNCYSIVGTDSQPPAPANLAGMCPNGIHPETQLDVGSGPNIGGIYGFGPCDQGGIPFA